MTENEVVIALISKIGNTPAEIEKAESAVLTAHLEAEQVRELLSAREGELLLHGHLIGKNAEERKAQLLDLSALQRADVRDAERAVEEAKIRLRRAQNDFSAAKAIARMLEGGAE